MKKFLSTVTMVISVAFFFAACTQTDVVDDFATSQLANPDNNLIKFDTYNAKKANTRAGASGNMTTATLQTNGFGVFAYYTGLETYGHYQSTTYTGEEATPGDRANHAPNFMYNQQVTYATDHWTYTPLKYWPNDFASGAVDAETPAAQGSSTYGGNVSFFAYAPYVSDANITADPTNGITAKTANSALGDPIISYSTSGNVDLLWGTLETTGTGGTATGGTNPGVPADGTAATGTYAKAIAEGNTVAVDLKKQEVDGQVKFLFKHALASIGGGENTVTGGGFKVQLDIDNSTDGAVSTATTGGARQDFVESTKNYWRTIVTIKEVSITNDQDASGAINGTETGLATSGDLNLATGVWSNTAGSGVVSQNVGTYASYSGTNYQLNTAIAEIKTVSPSTTYFTDLTSTNIIDYFEKNTHKGVEETAQNVYADADAAPIILIPGQTPAFKVAVEYVVRQYDAALASKYTEVTNKISKVITFPTVELNKHYTLVMHLGLTSVKFTAEVDDWEEYDSDGSTPGTADPVIVELPANEI